MSRILALLFICVPLFNFANDQASAGTDRRPRLILQITVDQLRGDLPTRFLDRLGKGGFRYLLENGTHYANAHYRDRPDRGGERP